MAIPKREGKGTSKIERAHTYIHTHTEKHRETHRNTQKYTETHRNTQKRRNKISEVRLETHDNSGQMPQAPRT